MENYKPLTEEEKVMRLRKQRGLTNPSHLNMLQNRFGMDLDYKAEDGGECEPEIIKQ